MSKRTVPLAGRLSKDGVERVDLQIVDVPGTLHHITVPSSELDDVSFSRGIPKLDGSSIRGFKEINESDMLIVPDVSTYALLPWNPGAARLLSFAKDMSGTRFFPRDPRTLAKRAEETAMEKKLVSYWGPEPEFFVFDRVSWETRPESRELSSGFRIESAESGSTAEPGKAPYPIQPKRGYYPAEPQDTLTAVRNETVRILKNNFNITVEAHHHEVGSAGQGEINIRYSTLLNQADNLITLKYTLKNVANQHGRVATFMPKPISGDNGSGLHTHVSVWKKTGSSEKNLFYDKDDKYAELSQYGRYFAGGVLEHSRSLAAIVAPTTNSYRRLVPGFEAPIFIAWSRGNRSANVRIPVYVKGEPAAKRLEFRTPDPSCNPYLAFAAIQLAGFDGVKKKMDPGNPVDEDIYKISEKRRRELGIKRLPGSLAEALDALRSDSEYLKPLFDSELLDWYKEYRFGEFLQVQSGVSPREFAMYFDA